MIAYDHIEPDIEKWPIHQVTLDRKGFLDEIKTSTLNALKAKHTGEALVSLLERTIYSEIIRVNRKPWRVDPPKEKQYWNDLKKRVFKAKNYQNEKLKDQELSSIIYTIIDHYSEEIVGAFLPKTYRFARWFLTNFFGIVFGKSRIDKVLPGKRKKRKRLYQRLKVYGDIEKIQSLAEKGTIVLVPTHFSNLDSILVGYVVDAKVGIPSFTYGAGLNLFNFGPAAYFMNRLGAYRVDRRKKNPIYLEVLKKVSDISIQKGVHNLFFPGGTRSRSGHLEDKLKLGLLSTTLEAQRNLLKNNADNKVFIVPLNLNYHFVLEAKYLIRQHLREVGKERYDLVKDMSRSKRKLIKFLWEFTSKGSEVHLSFGAPMDVLGNKVDQEGISRDQTGAELSLEEYFSKDGKMDVNYQRESEYTRHLAHRILDSFRKYNVVLSSTVVSYVAFKMLREEKSGLDVLELLALPKSELIISKTRFLERLSTVIAALKNMEKNKEVWLSQVLYESMDEVLKNGLSHLGLYHSRKPLVLNKEGDVQSEDVELLYYYHNRMPDYGLKQFFNIENTSWSDSIETVI